MQHTMTTQDERVHITLSGSFAFGDNQAFRDMLKQIEAQRVGLVSVDLSGVDFIDSAALGMLLLLRDTLESRGIGLELHQPVGQVKKMFDLSQFDTLFTIKS